MIIDHTHNFIFVHVPKTAGTSITEALLPLGGTYETAHRPARGIHEGHPEEWENYFTFGVIRNPYARAVSWWRFLKKKAREKAEAYDPGSFDNWVLNLDNDHPQEDPMAIPYAFGESQIDFLSDIRGRLPDHVARFENLSREWRVICRLHLGMEPPQMPREKFYGAYDYRAYYTAETKRAIGNQYQKDIEWGAYKF